MEGERRIVSELITLYRDLPCLWDFNSKEYKDHKKKRAAWKLLDEKWREIDPNVADYLTCVKTKIENLKGCYRRELKKVEASKRQTDSPNEVYKPILWYFDLLTFLGNRNEHRRSGVSEDITTDKCSKSEEDVLLSDKLEVLWSDDNLLISDCVGRRKNHHVSRSKHKHTEIKRNTETKTKLENKHTEPAIVNNSTKTCNSFGVYVGEQMESLSTYQRQIAEKLISDVIFLAKTKNLNLQSKVETTRQDSYDSPSSPEPVFLTLPRYSSGFEAQTRPSQKGSSRSHSSSPLHKASPLHESSPLNESSPHKKVRLDRSRSPPRIKTPSSPEDQGSSLLKKLLTDNNRSKYDSNQLLDSKPPCKQDPLTHRANKTRRRRRC